MSRRRLLLIGLSLVGVTVLTLAITRLNPNRADDSAERAVAALEQAGAKVDREGRSLTGPVVKVRLGGKAVTDADLSSLEALTDLTEVRLQGTSVSDAGLKHLRPLGKLRVLDLRGTPVTDAALAEVRDHHPGLEELILLQTNVTDAGLRQLKAPGNLRWLEVPPGCLTPTGYRAFRDLGLADQFPGLRSGSGRRGHLDPVGGEIEIIQFPPVPAVPDRFGEWLSEFPSLRLFSFAAQEVTDDVLRALARPGKLHMVVAIGPNAGMGMFDPEALDRFEAARPRRDEDVTELWLAHCPITDASVDALLGLKKLRSLGLDSTRVTGAGLARLAALPNLTSLSATGIRLTPDDLAAFRDRPALSLRADFDRSDAGLRRYRDAGVLHLLCDYPADPERPGRTVRTLDLSGAPVTDAGLAALAELTLLERLRLNNTAVTDDGLKHLAVLPGLVALDLDGTRVTGPGLRHLAGLTWLERLDLSGTDVGDAGVKELLALQRLRRLNLASTGVTDAGLEDLAKLAGLKEVELFGNRTTLEGVERFRAARPEVSMLFTPVSR